MSRGLGKMQSGILAEIERLGGEAFQNQLLWRMAELNAKISKGRRLHGDVYEGAIENSYKSSFMRAVTNLAEDEIIKPKDRLINDISELFTLYPFKTLSLEIYCLRRILLPELKNYIEEGYRHSPYSPHTLPRFRTNDHELFILANIKDSSPEFHKRVKAKWLAFESEILKILAIRKTSQFDIWMKLLLRSRQLFLEEKGLRYGLAFHAIIEKLLSNKDAMDEPEQGLLGRMEKFKGRVFQEDDIHRAAMKTALYQVGNFQKGGAATLHKEVKGFMLEKHPDLIRALPGHKDPPSSFIGGWVHELATFSKLLDKLIDRRIFSSFRFISVK